MTHPKFEDGTLVVIDALNTHVHGMIGLYQFRGPEYQTANVRQGCSVVSMLPDQIIAYNEYEHGRLPMMRTI